MKRIFKTYKLSGLIVIFLGIVTHFSYAQSNQLQLNLLLESDQSLTWSKEYPVMIADHIPAKIVLGSLEGENTLIGLFEISGLKNQLVLHGIQNEDRFILHEWLDNNSITGSLQLQNNKDSISGYWYNRDRTIRLGIRTKGKNSSDSQEIRQYQNGSKLFFTRYYKNTEEVMEDVLVDSETWESIRYPTKRCYNISINNRKTEFCRNGEIELYSYNRVDLERILHGQIPQIPYDEVFNTQISSWVDHWADQVFRDTLQEISESRWSQNQGIWFIPDNITSDIVSGMLTIQYSGNQIMHSRSMIYDRKKKIFYNPEDLFRSNTTWNEDFQKTARRYIYEKHQSTIDVFPEVMDRMKYHMTLNPEGLVISTDFTPYFGRLKIQLDHKLYENDLQRFAPFRKLLLE